MREYGIRGQGRGQEFERAPDASGARAWPTSAGHGEAPSRPGQLTSGRWTGLCVDHGPATRLPSGRSRPEVAPLPGTGGRARFDAAGWARRQPDPWTASLARRQEARPSTASLASLELVAAGPRSKKEEPSPHGTAGRDDAPDPNTAGASSQDYSGGDLLSQGATPQVPSAWAGLTSVFGMGTGVTPPLWPPETVAQLAGKPL